MVSAAARPLYDYYERVLKERFNQYTAKERKAFFDYLATMELLTDSARYNALSSKEQANVRKAYSILTNPNRKGSRYEQLNAIVGASDIVRIPTRRDYTAASDNAFKGLNIPKRPVTRPSVQQPDITKGGAGASGLTAVTPSLALKPDPPIATPVASPALRAVQDYDSEEEVSPTTGRLRNLARMDAGEDEEEKQDTRQEAEDDRRQSITFVRPPTEIAEMEEKLEDLKRRAEGALVAYRAAVDPSPNPNPTAEELAAMETDYQRAEERLDRYVKLQMEIRKLEANLAISVPRPDTSAEPSGVTTAPATGETEEYNDPPADEGTAANTTENIEDQMKAGEYAYVEPTAAVEQIPVATSASVQAAVENMVAQVEEQEQEQQIANAVAQSIQQDGDAVLTAEHQNEPNQIPNPVGVSVPSAVVGTSAAQLQIAEDIRTRVDAQSDAWIAANPEADPRSNPYIGIQIGYANVPATTDAVLAPNVAEPARPADPLTDARGGSVDQGVQTQTNVGTQGQGDPAVLGNADADYYYDLPAFLNEGGQQSSMQNQVSTTIMDKLQTAQTAAATMADGDIGKMAEGKSIDQLKRDIQAICYLFDQTVPALKSADVQRRKQMIMRSDSRTAVMQFYTELMAMVKKFFASDQLRVGVIVGADSAAGGGGAGSGLPGMGAAGYSMNIHGQDTFHPQRGDQFINRGGRNYRRAIENRVPHVMPSLRPKPVKLERTLGFPNMPFPTIRRAANNGIMFTLKSSTSNQSTTRMDD